MTLASPVRDSRGGVTFLDASETAATADLDGAWSSSILDCRDLREKLLYFRSTANVAITVKVMSLRTAGDAAPMQIGGDISLGDGSVTATTNWMHVTDHHPFIRIDVTSGGAAGSGSLVVTASGKGAI